MAHLPAPRPHGCPSRRRRHRGRGPPRLRSGWPLALSPVQVGTPRRMAASGPRPSSLPLPSPPPLPLPPILRDSWRADTGNSARPYPVAPPGTTATAAAHGRRRSQAALADTCSRQGRPPRRRPVPEAQEAAAPYPAEAAEVAVFFAQAEFSDEQRP